MTSTEVAVTEEAKRRSQLDFANQKNDANGTATENEGGNIFEREIIRQGKKLKNFFEWIKSTLLSTEVLEFIRKIMDFLQDKPYLTMPLFVLALVIFVPIFIFAFFMFITAAISFGGFVIAEGTILSIGAVIVIAFLLSTLGISITLCTLYSVLYFSLYKLNIIK